MLPQNYNIFPETKGKDADDELDISVWCLARTPFSIPT
jgi:hypothetical protein